MAAESSLLIYIVLALTFGYTMIMAETALGRMTGKSPVGAYASFAKPGKRGGFLGFGGWINAIIPVLIVPYYSVIGGWVIKYLVEYLAGQQPGAGGGRLSSLDFISNGAVGGDLLPGVCAVHAGHHLCGCAQRRRACVQST